MMSLLHGKNKITERIDSLGNRIQTLLEYVEPIIEGGQLCRKGMLLRFDMSKAYLDTVEAVVNAVKPLLNTANPLFDTIQPPPETIEPLFDTIQPLPETIEPLMNGGKSPVEPCVQFIKVPLELAVFHSMLSCELLVLLCARHPSGQ